ncbi:multiubiquitin domain-containing protein [Enterobacter cloacae complex sp. 301C7]|uniref:multiubiquitin domain-containing protein n=1 Tax=Enterobacter cloacae complex sp. 301C7 TaxID=3395848 RepID=UPI003CEAC53E
MNNEKYIVRIADESFNFQEFSFDDSKITGAEVADAFGAHPVENYRIYQQVKNLELEELRPIEKADISEPH